MKNILTLQLIKIYFHKIKKKILNYFFLWLYGRIYFYSNLRENLFFEKKIIIDKLNYSVFTIPNGKLYTDRIVNVAYINNNFLFSPL